MYSEQIFDGLQFTLNNIINMNTCCPVNNASVGTFCVKIGQSLKVQYDMTDMARRTLLSPVILFEELQKRQKPQ